MTCLPASVLSLANVNSKTTFKGSLWVKDNVNLALKYRYLEEISNKVWIGQGCKEAPPKRRREERKRKKEKLHMKDLQDTFGISLGGPLMVLLQVRTVTKHFGND